jgi:hypothetical protein
MISAAGVHRSWAWDRRSSARPPLLYRCDEIDNTGEQLRRSRLPVSSLNQRFTRLAMKSLFEPEFQRLDAELPED